MTEPGSEAPYEVVVRSQAGAEALLLELGALEQVQRVLLDHCAAQAPAPQYKPQEYKRRLAAFGWKPEVRVPPYSQEFDGLPINERYDAYKVFREDVPFAVELRNGSPGVMVRR